MENTMLVLLFTLGCRENGFVKYNASSEVLITSHDENTDLVIGSEQEFIAEVSGHFFRVLAALGEIDNVIVCPVLPLDVSGQNIYNVTTEEGHKRVKLTVKDQNKDICIDSSNLVLTEKVTASLSYIEATSSDKSLRNINIWNDISNVQFKYEENVYFDFIELGSQHIS